MRPLALVVLLVLSMGQAPAPAPGKVEGVVTVMRDNQLEPKPENVYVYLERQPIPTRHRNATSTATAAIHQVNREFKPHVLVVASGTRVFFPNDDNETHNVFFPTSPPGPHDFGRYGSDPKGPSRVFDIAKEYEIYCDVHKEMWARLKVVDTTLIAQAPAGKFSVDALAPGDYLLHAWAPFCTSEAVVPVHVESGKAISIDPKLLKVQCTPINTAHKNKNGQPYVQYGR